MKRTIATTSTALVLSLAALTGADAAALNTVPLNAFGKPVSSTPVAYGGINTTINSSIKPYVPPTIKPVTLNTVPLNTQAKPVSSTPVAYGGVNTTINSSVNPYVVPSSKPVTLNTVPLNTLGKPVSSTPVAYGLTNTTINSSLNVPKTVVTTAAGLPAITTGTFAVPNIKATIATGPIPVPKQGGASFDGGFFGDSSSNDGGSGIINGIYHIGVATVGYYGARAVITIAGWAGAAGATTAGTTAVAQGATGAAGANAVVDTVTIGGAEAAGGTSVAPIIEVITGLAL